MKRVQKTRVAQTIGAPAKCDLAMNHFEIRLTRHSEASSMLTLHSQNSLMSDQPQLL